MMKISFFALFCITIFVTTATAQNRIVPIIEMNSGALLGGAQNGKWLDVKTTIQQLSDENVYKFFGLTNDSGGREVNLARPRNQGVPCEGFYGTGDQEHSALGVAFGKNISWNPVPRIPKAIDLNNAIYKKSVSDVLRSKGIFNAKVNITKAVRVDLEGDGQEEVLIEATSYKDNIQPSAKRGDYSLILLRKIIGGKAQNIVVSGEFITKNIKFGAPGKYELSAIADLNGDGKMEIVVYASYYEGMWIETYEMKRNKPLRVKILDVGCGV